MDTPTRPRRSRPKLYPLTLAELAAAHHLTPAKLARLTGRPESTTRRWLRTGQTTPEALRLLEITLTGTLPSRAECWNGWRVVGPWLVDHEGGHHEADEIRANWLIWQMLAEKKRGAQPEQMRLF